MKTLEQLKNIYLAKAPKYLRNSNPEPFLYKRKLLSDILSDDLTVEEYNLINSHYLELKKKWQESKNRFKARLLNMPDCESSKAIINNL